MGVAPSSMALPSRPGRKPQPSSTINTTGVRAARVLFILKGMQVSQVLRALPVVLGLAQRLSAQADVRVQTEGEWFFQEPDGKRLAQVPRGAVVGGGAGRGARGPVAPDASAASPPRPDPPPVGSTPGPRPGADPTPARPPPVDPSRAQPARRTTLYRAPDGPAAGALAPETPLRVLGRSGG